MKLRKRRHNQQLPLEYEDLNGDNVPLDVADWSPNPEQLYTRAEVKKILRKALGELPPILRVVFVLRDVEGLSIKETGAALDLPPTAVKSRPFRARLQLREKLTKYFRQPLLTAHNSALMVSDGAVVRKTGTPLKSSLALCHLIPP